MTINKDNLSLLKSSTTAKAAERDELAQWEAAAEKKFC